MESCAHAALNRAPASSKELTFPTSSDREAPEPAPPLPAHPGPSSLHFNHITGKWPQASTQHSPHHLTPGFPMLHLCQGSWKWLEKAGLKFSTQKLRSWHPVPSLHGKQMGKNGNSDRLHFSWAPKSLQMVTATMKLKDTCSLEEKL